MFTTRVQTAVVYMFTTRVQTAVVFELGL